MTPKLLDEWFVGLGSEKRGPLTSKQIKDLFEKDQVQSHEPLFRFGEKESSLTVIDLIKSTSDPLSSLFDTLQQTQKNTPPPEIDLSFQVKNRDHLNFFLNRGALALLGTLLIIIFGIYLKTRSRVLSVSLPLSLPLPLFTPKNILSSPSPSTPTDILPSIRPKTLSPAPAPTPSSNLPVYPHAVQIHSPAELEDPQLPQDSVDSRSLLESHENEMTDQTLPSNNSSISESPPLEESTSDEKR